nr:hypothetical protein [Nocardia abscessus]
MTETELTWCGVATNQIGRLEFTETLQHLSVVGIRDRGDQIHTEGVAGHRPGLKHPERVGRQPRQLLGDHPAQGERNSRVLPVPREVARRVVGRPTAFVTRQLFEVERISATLSIERPDNRGIRSLAQRLRGLGDRQRRQLMFLHQILSCRVCDGLEQQTSRLPRTISHRQHHAWHEPPQQMANQLRRRGIGPMQIIQNQHQRPARRQLVEHRPNSPIELETLRHETIHPAPAPRRKHRSRSLIQSVEEDSERNFPFQLCTTTDKHVEARGFGSPGKFLQYA